MRRILLLVLLLAAATGLPWAQPEDEESSPTPTETPRVVAAPTPHTPPGFNVHLVVSRKTGFLWRGGGPRRDTLQSLAKEAKENKRRVTLIDLRRPPTTDDLSGKEGRLSPTAEAKMAEELGFRYRSISALDHDLVAFIAEAMRHGDVYIHCMYGVNRTGFAVGRFATADRLKVDRQGMGERDWQDGVRFQQRLEK